MPKSPSSQTGAPRIDVALFESRKTKSFAGERNRNLNRPRHLWPSGRSTDEALELALEQGFDHGIH